LEEGLLADVAGDVARRGVLAKDWCQLLSFQRRKHRRGATHALELRPGALLVLLVALALLRGLCAVAHFWRMWRCVVTVRQSRELATEPSSLGDGAGVKAVECGRKVRGRIAVHGDYGDFGGDD
jgi:hypothetical protein